MLSFYSRRVGSEGILQDGIGCQKVLALELMDEVGLYEGQAAPSFMSEVSERTNMPSVGIKVMISRKRQKENNKPPIILKML